MPLYRDPSRSRARPPGLIASLMRAPATASALPEENQFCEALAWALRAVPGLARDFALLAVRGDPVAEDAVRSADRVGVETRITALGPGGGVLFPDLSLCGDGRSFQLLVEVKVGASFADCRLPDGTAVSQPVLYAHALADEPASIGAELRRVATLSIDATLAPTDHHPLRAGDLSWADVQMLLAGAERVDGIHTAVDELGDLVLGLFTPVPHALSAELIEWADAVLPDVLRRLASAVGGSRSGPLTSGQTAAYRGGGVSWTSPEGTPATMWLYVSPAGGGPSVAGQEDAVYLQPAYGHGWSGDPHLTHRLNEGFEWEAGIQGDTRWRQWVPLEDVRAAGNTASQIELVAARFTDALAAGGLTIQRAG